MNIDIGKAFSFALERIKANPAYYIVGGLIVSAISFAVSMLGNVLSFIWGFFIGIFVRTLNLRGDIAQQVAGILGGLGGAMIGMILGFIVAPFFVGFFRGIKKEYEGGTAEIGDVFSALNIFIPSMLNYAVASLVVFVGFICCLIPGILLSPVIWLSIFFLARGESNGLDAFKKGFETLKKAPILILWTIVLGIFAMLGLLACCVGVFVTVPMSAAALYVVFSQAVGDDGSGDAKQVDAIQV